MSGFDSVDDESRPEVPMENIYPEDWNYNENPPYQFWAYYFWANITSLNQIRSSKGLSMVMKYSNLRNL